MLGLGDNKGKVWGEYYLTGKKSDAFFNALVDVVMKNEPVIGSKFNAKKKRRKRK